MGDPPQQDHIEDRVRERRLMILRDDGYILRHFLPSHDLDRSSIDENLSPLGLPESQDAFEESSLPRAIGAEDNRYLMGRCLKLNPFKDRAVLTLVPKM